MVNSYTDITSGTSLGLNLVKTGYEKLVDFKLRSEPLFRRCADKRATALTNPGESVVFNIYNDLSPTTTAISETSNPDSVAVPTTDDVTVTLEELGETVIPTLRLRTLTFSDIDPAVANIVARHQAESIDLKVRAAIGAGDNALYADGTATGNTADGTSGVGDTDTVTPGMFHATVAKLRGANVVEKLAGNTFGAFIHPDVAYDLRQETGMAGWLYPHANVAPENIWLSQVGTFGGVSFIESPRVEKADDGEGTAPATVYRTYVFGSQALAEVTAIEPHLVIGPVTDPMMRFRPLSWHGLAGWSIYRQEALWRLETSSSIASL